MLLTSSGNFHLIVTLCVPSPTGTEELDINADFFPSDVSELSSAVGSERCSPPGSPPVEVSVLLSLDPSSGIVVGLSAEPCLAALLNGSVICFFNCLGLDDPLDVT